MAVGGAANPAWQLTQKTLPALPRGGVERLQFSPDGTRILMRGLSEIKLLQTDSFQEITSFKAKGSHVRFGRFLEGGAVAYDNAPTPELLLPDLTKRSLPLATTTISEDGKFVFTAGRKSGVHDTVRAVAGGDAICTLPGENSLQRVTFSSRYAAVATRGGFAVCDLQQHQLTWLTDARSFDYVAGWVDPQSRWLLVIWTKNQFIGDSTTRAILYALPLVAKGQVERASGGSSMEVEPVKVWDSHAFRRAAFSPDGRWLTLISERRVELVRMDALDEPVIVDPDFDSTNAFYSRDSRWMALQGEKQIFIANLNTEPRFAVVTPPFPVASFKLHDIAPDGSALLATTRETERVSESNVMWRITPAVVMP